MIARVNMDGGAWRENQDKQRDKIIFKNIFK